ncbi:MAG: DUF3379 family protein [Gammaproteobacteria bacterium]|jgi:hypothetical protein
MNCETLREQLAQDPARANEEFDRHAQTCPACEAYRKRLLRAEALIQEALRFDVRAIGQAAEDPPLTSSSRSGWVTWASGLAAGLLVAVTFWTFLGSGADLTPEALARKVVDHWYHEPDSWVQTSRPVAATVLAEVLEGEAELNLSALRTVSYARTCWVAGEWIPHLVVQGEAGPYMVLLMPGRLLESPVPLELREEGLSGRIVPAGGGSIAILGGGESPEIERVENSLVSAVDWTI